jgi:hypothetical protein
MGHFEYLLFAENNVRKLHMRFFRRTYLICFLLLFFSVVAFAQQNSRSDENSYPVAIARDKVVVPLFVNGNGPYPFILDFGVQHTVVSPFIAEAIRTAAGGNAPSQGASQDVEIGELKYNESTSSQLRALVMDLSPFASSLGTEIVGVFNGREFGEKISVDLAAGKIDFESTAGSSSSAMDTRDIKIKFDAQGQPIVTALINDKHTRSFVLDLTFAGALSMPEQSLRDLGLFACDNPGVSDVTALRVEPAPEEFSASTPPPEAMQVRLKSLRVGGAVMEAPICSASQIDASPRIGLGFLKHFKVAIDFGAKTLRLSRKGTTSVTCGPILGCGLIPARFNEGRWTLWVTSNSPAARAGVRSGAQLIDVGGADILSASYSEVCEKLSADEGATLSVTIQQGAEKRTLALSVEPLL